MTRNVQTVTAIGSDGYVCFRRDTGEITKREGYGYIKSIDVKEWSSYYEKEMPDTLDILDVGYYTYDGLYEPPVSDFRQNRGHTMQAFLVDGQYYTGGEIPGQVDAVYGIEGGSVRVALTHEGIIIDRLDGDGNVVSTFSADPTEMIELTH